MKNIHILATDKPSRLYEFGGEYHLQIKSQENFRSQNIYITSDEEIKEGDKDFYIIANDRDKTWINRLEKVVECKIDPKHGKVLILSSGFLYVDEGKKIILTTDQDLIKDGVQDIDDEFLEWFVNNPSCEEVEEAALSIIPDRSTAGWIDSFGATERIGFIKGAKWMQEKMYSEEDLLNAFEAGMMFIGEDKESFREWFEKFKKK